MIVRRLTRQMLCQPFLLIFAFGWSMETTIRWHVGEEKLGDMCIFEEGRRVCWQKSSIFVGGRGREWWVWLTNNALT